MLNLYDLLFIPCGKLFVMEHVNNISERNWELLLEAIDGKRVIPIIGDDFFYLVEDGEEIDVKDYLICNLSQKFNVKEPSTDFSTIADAIELENFMNKKIRFVNIQTDIYYEINQLLQSKTIFVKESLHKLLSLNKFPLILTTSFIPGLEQLFSQSGCECVSLSYDKTADSDLNASVKSTSGVLIYYLFGKCSKIKKSYMVTEEDLLEYIHLWHEQDARPPKLTKYLANKFLLVLGCNYPNWLFRFFWHSIRNFSLAPSDQTDRIMEMMQAIVSVDKVKEDADLHRFLSRIHTSIYSNSRDFINELTEHWDSYSKGKSEDESFDETHIVQAPNSDDIDVFISYANEDKNAARHLSEILRKLGANIWFDDRELILSEKYEAEIRSAIARAKRFMPVLSATTLIEKPRFFRKEWAIAHSVMDDRFGLPFFAPIIVDDSDPKDIRIPETFRQCHIISMQSVDVELQLKKFVRSIR